MAVKEQPDKAERYLEILNRDLQALRVQVAAARQSRHSEVKRQHEFNDQSRAAIQSAHESIENLSRGFGYLESRLAVVKTDASKGIVFLVVVFAVLFVGSFLFQR